MGLGTLLLAAAVGGGTYAIATNKQGSDGTAAVAGLAAGAGTAVAVPILLGILGWVIILGLITIPAAGVYYMVKGNDTKALPPGR